MRVVVSDAEVTLADVLSLRLAMDEPLADGTELVLRNRATAAESRVRLGTPGARVREATLAVSLAPLELGPGRWDAYLRHEESRTRLRSVDPGFSLDHLDAYALSRRTLAYRAYRTRNGFLALKIDNARPAAEVRSVWFREGRFEVTGLLTFTGLDDDESRHEARLALRRSRPDAELTAAATVQGVRFHAALSLCDVVAAAGESGTWEPSLRVDGVATPLRLGSKLDDVDGKRRRLHYPAAQIDGVPIRPCYTADDELRIEVGG
ncbi:hypothetical protein FHS43_003811 [Streptosporangium becharense]|uniref:Uncharacterized protein n=1 Tax=Streptosporangium becharense TaxID=1816182 RepID=A0A7W9IH66_9ACTN|nr:hypothetical protein [Streptosporangium becharense]MBB2912528.1 hypothetical protein [Streptosporangium becharense]MBB5820642.1 hypothetical protein [Streptosporangium becharense]